MTSRERVLNRALRHTPQLTVSESCNVRETELELAFTVRDDVPVGVPVLLGFGPPPQPSKTDAEKRINNAGKTNRSRTFVRKVLRVPRSATKNNATNKGRGIRGSTNSDPPGTPSDRAVVVTVTVNGATALPLREIEVGTTEHVAAAGAPEQRRETVPLNPEGMICRL